MHSVSEDDIVKSIRGNEGWHHDSTYMPVQAKGAVFSAEIIPTEGAATGFADMRAAYDALGDATRSRVSDMSAYHSLEYSQHPETGRTNLLIGRHAHDIVGLNRAESEALLDGLNDWACESPRSYHHEWNVGDTMVWDNRRLMHRATPFDLTEPRRMWHTRVAGERASELALNFD